MAAGARLLALGLIAHTVLEVFVQLDTTTSPVAQLPQDVHTVSEVAVALALTNLLAPHDWVIAVQIPLDVPTGLAIATY